MSAKKMIDDDDKAIISYFFYYILVNACNEGRFLWRYFLFTTNNEQPNGQNSSLKINKKYLTRARELKLKQSFLRQY